MMHWELYGCWYTYDDGGVYEGISGETFLGSYDNFDAAFKAFSENMSNFDLPRLWVKVYRDNDENDCGEILLAYSNIWGDKIFNEDGI